jgi:glycosyltransferase involved in cell wall biosynthesis
MTDDLVSVIIPTYNRADLIIKTIKSVLRQTYQNIEIIIVDDGSTDNTEELIRKLNHPKIRFVKQNHTGLPAPGRNTGVKLANGKYIAFLDSDDIWFSNKLETQIKTFQKKPKLLMVCSNAVIFPGKPKKMIPFLLNSKIISLKSIVHQNNIINSSVMLKKEVFASVGLLSEDRKLKATEDYEYWVRISDYRDKSIFLLRDTLMGYRLHASGISYMQISPKLTLKVSHIFKKYQSKHKWIQNAVLEYYQYIKYKNDIQLSLKSIVGFMKNNKIRIRVRLRGFIFFLYTLVMEQFLKKK